MSQRKTIYDNRFWLGLLSWYGKWFLKCAGWTIKGDQAPAKKMVVIAAPHTSNWDFPLFMAFVGVTRLRVSFLGKDSLFKIPVLGRLFYYLGGIPVEREGIKAKVAMTTALQVIEDADELVLGIAPEGTRSKVTKWKTGFYRIAKGANIPIGMAYVDSKTKTLGIHPEPFYPTGDMETDIEKIQLFYKDKTGVKSEK